MTIALSHKVLGNLLQTALEAARVFNVMQCAQMQVGLLLRCEFAHGFGRAANDHAAVRELFAFCDQSPRAHNATFANFGAIEHDGPNADQGTITDSAPMQHHLMAYGHVVSYGQRFADVGVQHAAILNVGTAPDSDGLGVAAYDDAKPDTGVFGKFHISDDLGAVCDPGRMRNAGSKGIELVKGHDEVPRMEKPRIVKMELRQRALDAFNLTDPWQKAAATMALWREGSKLELDCQQSLLVPAEPGRPALPALVHPQDVPRRSPFTPEGHCALMHSIAHIEFNAVNLALDAIWRFGGMPPQYYLDWLRVAGEEAKHFTLLSDHLQTQGHRYGDFVAHDGLWTVCQSTRHDIVARMALVPRTLEARGLDATPIIQTKLRKVGTPRALTAVAILDTILAEEVGHVAIGNYWYHWLCHRDGLNSEVFYTQVASLHRAPRLKPPFNLTARRQAGFSELELLNLSTIAST